MTKQEFNALGDLLKAPFPDWLKVLLIGGFLGFSYAGMKGGQDEIVEQLRANATADSLRWEATNRNLARLLRLSNQEHSRMWKSIGRADYHRDIE